MTEQDHGRADRKPAGIDLDNQATTPSDPAAVEAIGPFFTGRISALKTRLSEGIKGRLSGVAVSAGSAQAIEVLTTEGARLCAVGSPAPCSGNALEQTKY